MHARLVFFGKVLGRRSCRLTPAFTGAYHGRTFGALGVTKSKTIYGEGVAPLMVSHATLKLLSLTERDVEQPGTFPIPFPYWHQHNLLPSTSPSILTAQSLYQLHLLLAQQTSPSETAAIIIEPVLGEGGYVPAPKEFLEGLREVCDKHNILLIVDEVQSGFGRTGSWFYIEESGVRPDILIMAKVNLSMSRILLAFDRDLVVGARQRFPVERCCQSQGINRQA